MNPMTGDTKYRCLRCSRTWDSSGSEPGQSCQECRSWNVRRMAPSRIPMLLLVAVFFAAAWLLKHPRAVLRLMGKD
ncbi:MAG: hypothetical protein HY293_19915 [Planctomycetes bacterium]|nr:hypothetical protein [Planctomycetota bacterium]